MANAKTEWKPFYTLNQTIEKTFIFTYFIGSFDSKAPPWSFRTFVLLFVFHLKPNLRIDITVVDGIPLPIAKAFCLLKNCN